MPEETQEAVNSIGFELVSKLAPEELPLYQSLADQQANQSDFATSAKPT